MDAAHLTTVLCRSLTNRSLKVKPKVEIQICNTVKLTKITNRPRH